MPFRAAAALAAAVVLLAAPAAAQDGIRTERVKFAAGASSATIKGKLHGSETVDYILGARRGQHMTVKLAARNRSMYFNVLVPGGDSALFVGSTSGDAFEGTLPADGDYVVRAYLMRNAARRGESSDYTLDFRIAASE
jgi:hypothetical protein